MPCFLFCGFTVLRRGAIDIVASGAGWENQLVRCHSQDIAMDEMEVVVPFGHTSAHLVPHDNLVMGHSRNPEYLASGLQ